MKTLRFCFALCVAALLIGGATPALGLANRVFVSQRSGNDANSCDNILTPCQTFAGAVLQLNPGGEVIVLDSGGYGPVTITQSLTIEAPPGVLAFIHPPSGDGITVNAGASDTVVLRGLVLNGGSVTKGIAVNTVGVLHVESCVISGFGSAGISFEASGSLFVNDTFVRKSFYGIIVKPVSSTANALIDHCRLEGNTFGLDSEQNAKLTVRDSVASGNSNTGFFASNGELNIENCVVTANDFGGILSNSGGFVRVSNTTVTDNNIGIGTDGASTLLSRSNNTIRGNTPNGSFTGTFAAD